MKYRHLTSVSAAALLIAVAGTAHAQSTTNATVNPFGNNNVTGNTVTDNQTERTNKLTDSFGTAQQRHRRCVR